MDMLEEFAYLKSEQGGSVSLDIQPISAQKLTKLVSQKVSLAISITNSSN